MNWISGVILLGLTLALGFTGQLLRWDQDAVWTVVVGAEQAGRIPWVGKLLAGLLLGGPTLGADTLNRFYALHAMLLPVLLAGLVGFHVYLLLRNGVTEPPRSGRPVEPTTYRDGYEGRMRLHGVPFWPYAVWRDAVFGAFVVIVVFVLAWVFGAPKLDLPPDPSLVHAHPRPDWYFLFYFSLLALMPHGLESYVILLGPLLAVIVLILLPLLAPTGERSPARRPWAIGFTLIIVTTVGVLTVAGYHANWSPKFDARALPPSVVASQDDKVQRGATLFHDRACMYCHRVAGYGGRRGPDLSHIGSLRTKEQLIIQILNGGYNMPAFGSILAPDQLDAIVTFLQSRR
jgi:ubiquinol-cytochrome c reductase cytochrome b subunit